jgi:hypothetical protein
MSNPSGSTPARFEYLILAKVVVYAVRICSWEMDIEYLKECVIEGETFAERLACMEWYTPDNVKRENVSAVEQASFYCGSMMGIPSDILKDALALGFASDFEDMDKGFNEWNPISECVNNLMLEAGFL